MLRIGDDPGSLERAAEYLHGQARNFYQMGPRLDVLERELLEVVADSAAIGDRDRQLAAHNLANAVEALHRQWDWAQRQLQWVQARIPGLGLSAWVIPVAVSGIALALAGWIAVLLHREALVREAYDRVAAGELTVDEANRIGQEIGGGGPLIEVSGSGVLMGAAVVGGLIWLSRSRRRTAAA